MSSPANSAHTIALLPGDGIGPEVMEATKIVIRAAEQKFQLRFDLREGLIGGIAFDRTGQHFPDDTRELIKSSHAILFGSVGGPIDQQQMPKWQGCEANSILSLRKALDLYANLRPVSITPALANLSPVKLPNPTSKVDILFVRELSSDIYFGEHELGGHAPERFGTDLAIYRENEVIRIAHLAFKAARERRGKLTSVDKANVLSSSKLWRAIVSEVHQEYRNEVQLEHMLVDNCAMQLITKPTAFDVILTGNLFGDILSDLGAALPGSLGVTPSASLNEQGFGLYEPSGGSAPDIAGKGIANPAAQILSFALLCRHSLKRSDVASSIEVAVENTLAAGVMTADLLASNSSQPAVNTTEFAQYVAGVL